MKNDTPYDRRKYNWGRYRDNYPRTSARNWVMREGVEEYYAEDHDISACECEGMHDENCTGMFARPAVSVHPEPVHSSEPREEEHSPGYWREKACVHSWQHVIQKRYVARPTYYWRDYGTISYGGAWYPEDPVLVVTTCDRCVKCYRVENEEIIRRELLPHERINYEERRRMNTPKPIPSEATPVKKHTKKTGRRRK